MLLKEVLVKLWSLRSNTTVLLTLLSTFCICSLKSSFDSRNIPKCFWISDWIMHGPSYVKEGWFEFWSLREKITSCAYLLISDLKLIFHWKAQQLIFFKSWFKPIKDWFISCITEKSEVSSANSLRFEVKLSDKSLM